MLQSLSKKNILRLCVAVSLCFHAISILFLQTQSLWNATPTPQVEQHASLSKLDKTHILKEAFEDSRSKTAKIIPTTPTIQSTSETIGQTQLVIEHKKPEPFVPKPVPFSANEPLTQSTPSTFSLPKIKEFNLLNHLSENIIAAPSLVAPQTLASSPVIPAQLINPPSAHPINPNFKCIQQTIKHSSKKLAMDEVEGKKEPPLLLSQKELNIEGTVLSQNELSEPQENFHTVRSIKPKLPIPKSWLRFPSFPTLRELGATSCSDHFDTEILFSELDNEEGYFFAITLIPNSELDLPKIRQHYSFLIDRSNSIQKERLTSVKNAVFKAIKELDIDDSFNVIAFDSKIDKLYPAPMPATPAAIRAAKDFLASTQLGSFFSPANLCKPLMLTLPSSDEDLHTTILLTDGDPLHKKVAQRELALGWTSMNQGRSSLFMIGLGSDSHLETLDAIAALNRGKLSYSPTKGGIRRKLLKLMKTISHPIAKNISTQIVQIHSESSDQSKGPILYPLPHQAPHLYKQEPYTIFGTTKTLEPFVLFVQGKAKDKWIHIKKSISFANAKKGSSSLKAQWALQQAYQIYGQYLYDQNPEHLVHVGNLLEPHNLRIAFQ